MKTGIVASSGTIPLALLLGLRSAAGAQAGQHLRSLHGHHHTCALEQRVSTENKLAFTMDFKKAITQGSEFFWPSDLEEPMKQALLSGLPDMENVSPDSKCLKSFKVDSILIANVTQSFSDLTTVNATDIQFDVSAKKRCSCSDEEVDTEMVLLQDLIVSTILDNVEDVMDTFHAQADLPPGWALTRVSFLDDSDDLDQVVERRRATCFDSMAYATDKLASVSSFSYDIEKGKLSDISDTIDTAASDTLAELLSIAASEQINDNDDSCIKGLAFTSVEFDSEGMYATSSIGGGPNPFAYASIGHDGDAILNISISYDCKCDGIVDSSKIEGILDKVQTQANDVTLVLDGKVTQDGLFWYPMFRFNNID